MLEIRNGKIFVNGKETQDHELIALAVKDIAEENPKATIIIADDKKLVSIIESYTELVQISEFAKEQIKENQISLCSFNLPFKHNFYSTKTLYSLLMMIKNGSLIVAPQNFDIVLNMEDKKIFGDAINNPPKANSKLNRAKENHSKHIEK